MMISYLSKPASDLSGWGLQDIWVQSLEYNEKHDVSGVLFFGGDLIFQILEGEEDVVQPLFDKVAKDPRHQSVQILSINDVATAMFRGTPMKLIDGSHSAFLKTKFSYERFQNGGLAAANKAAFDLLKL